MMRGDTPVTDASSSHPTNGENGHRPRSPLRRIPAPNLGVAIAIHVWLGLMGLGWWFTEWLIARADAQADDLGPTGDLGLILLAGGLLWVAAMALIVRLHPAAPRLTWLVMFGWVAVSALLFGLA
ncbi:MAG TPA: hypothetical protein VGR16_06795 [Thermomicrobiales bacterium]|nr:hypothetical protein [Thermomicrobiales bacterium]